MLNVNAASHPEQGCEAAGTNVVHAPTGTMCQLLKDLYTQNGRTGVPERYVLDTVNKRRVGLLAIPLFLRPFFLFERYTVAAHPANVKKAFWRCHAGPPERII